MSDRVPKPYRQRLHRLKNAYRKVYRREPELERPVTEQRALQTIAFLEGELLRAGVVVEDSDVRKAAPREKPRG